MPPKLTFAPNGPRSGPMAEKWASASWIPHASLPQTLNVSLLLRSAHMNIDSLNYSENMDIKVEVSLYGAGCTKLVPIECHSKIAPVEPRKIREEFKPLVSHMSHDCFIESIMTLPFRWKDVPRDSFLLFEAKVSNAKIYQGTFALFSAFGRLNTGLQRVKLRPGKVDMDKNLGLTIDKANVVKKVDIDEIWKASKILEHFNRMDSMASGSKGSTDRPRYWLDTLQIERAKEIMKTAASENKFDLIRSLADDGLSLLIQLPDFTLPVVHEDTFYPTHNDGACGGVTPLELATYRKSVEGACKVDELDPLELVTILDYENEDDNPAEDKYRALAHDLLRGLVDPNLKPDRYQRQRIAAIIDSPSHHPTREERDLLWRFRFSLVDNHRALTKFLVAVDWSVESEVVQAAELLEQWRRRSPIEVTDALKLLGKHVAFQTSLVRSYAIDTLAGAPDEELRLYLLQLVQALKYESTDDTSPQELDSPKIASQTKVAPLAFFLINRASQNLQLANYLYWYIKVELESPTHAKRYREVFEALKASLSKSIFDGQGFIEIDKGKAGKSFKSLVNSVSKIGTQLRHVNASQKDSEKTQKFQQTFWDILSAQDDFISGVLNVQRECRDSRGKKDMKEAQLKEMLKKEGYDHSTGRSPVPLPSTPSILVNGVDPESARMFKSALYPALIGFHVQGVAVDSPINQSKSDQSSIPAPSSPRNEDDLNCYKVIVKTGDDLRQDQLIIMMIQLMDGLLRRAALDLCLTPYSVIATGPTSGLVQFVDGAMPISQILSNYNGSILQYFQAIASAKGSKYDIKSSVLTTYIRSCAGYCVITYLLGIGDRHLDNLMLRSTGAFFHIDFGFVFGRDPKPLPPPFRLTREMVDGMGGMDSKEYRQFCSLACQAFNVLRKSAGLILNLLHLMSDAGIEDLSNNPSSDAEGVLNSVEERFRLDLSDEEAEKFFLALINDSLAALAPRVMDVFHSISVARR